MLKHKSKVPQKCPMENQEEPYKSEVQTQPQIPSQKSAKSFLYAIIAVLAIGSFAYKVINYVDYGQSALMFVGLPTLISLLLVKTASRPKSAIAFAMFGTTLFLMLSLIVLGEGLICVLMASPIFYGIAAIIGGIVQYFSKKNQNKLHSFLIIPLILIIGQPHQFNQVPPLETVVSEFVLDDVYTLDNLNQNPQFLDSLPLFFQMGFPKPLEIEGSGTAIGDARIIQFLSSTKGVGALHLEVVEKDENRILFKVKEDKSHIARWLSWEEIEVHLEPVSNKKTKIIWKSKYRCLLNPFWYFRPIERFAVQTSNQFLINIYFNQKDQLKK